MNIASPQEQFESARRLRSLPWKQPEKPTKPPMPYSFRYRERVALAPLSDLPTLPEPDCVRPVERDWLIIAHTDARRALVKDIVAATSAETKVSVNDILSKRRPAKVILARHVAMFLAKEMTNHSMPHLGRLFGGFDHTSVQHAIRRISKLLEQEETSEGTNDLLGSIRARLEGGN